MGTIVNLLIFKKPHSYISLLTLFFSLCKNFSPIITIIQKINVNINKFIKKFIIIKSNIIKLKYYLNIFNIKRLNRLTSIAEHININNVFSNNILVLIELKTITKIYINIQLTSAKIKKFNIFLLLFITIKIFKNINIFNELIQFDIIYL